MDIEPEPDRTLSISFLHNNRPLGEAFRVKQPTPVLLFPTVGFSSSPQKVSIMKGDPPPKAARAPPVYEDAEGDYGLRSCTGADGLSMVTPPCSMKVFKQGAGYRLGIKVRFCYRILE